MAKIKRSTSQARIGRNYYSFTVEEVINRPLSDEKRRRLEKRLRHKHGIVLKAKS
jgi:hypothetical protein